MIGLFWGCQPASGSQSVTAYESIQGETMGTYYQVTSTGYRGTDLQKRVEALLAEINEELSTYIENSTISQFNQATASLSISQRKL